MFERFPEYEHLLASLQLAFAMLGMGALLAPRDFVDVARRPVALGVGLGVQLGAVPLLAFALGRALDLPPGIVAGLALVAAVPGGTLSNLVTHLGGGNIALSVSLTAVTTVGALITTPWLLELLIAPQLPPDFAMPRGRVAFEIGVTLLMPLGAGMLFGMRRPAAREAFARWSIRISFGFIALLAIGGAGSGRLDPRDYGVLGLVSIVLLCAGAQIVALGVTRLARFASADRLAIGVEVTVRNTNLALLVKASAFPAGGELDAIGNGMFFVALLYGGVAPLVVAPLVLRHRRHGARWTPSREA